MSELLDWARQRPKGNERWILEELDSLESESASRSAASDRKAREQALEILVRRGVLSQATAEKVRRSAPGSAADVLPPPPRPSKPSAVVDASARDGGAVAGSVLIVTAPFAYLLALLGVDMGALMWVVTVWLLLGVIVIVTTGGRSPRALGRVAGRLGRRALLLLGFASLVTPIATLAVSLADLRAAPEFFGATVAIQAMTVFVMFLVVSVAPRPSRTR